MKVALTVNGQTVTGDVAPRMHLADFLRENLHLTGTHTGCEHGVCGACTVVINGETARSCITYAVACDGAAVRTIEGFQDDALMEALRRAFKQEHALQCGFCTPGMLIAARDLIRRKQGLDERAIRLAMSGNLCRCTGYVGIVRAIGRVMAEREGWLADVEPPARHLGSLPAGLSALAALPEAHSRQAAVSIAAAPAATATEPWDDAGATRIEETFRIAFPRRAVAAFMGDVERMATCLPGAELDGPPIGDDVSGRLNVRLGPISAAFAGKGRISRAPDGNSGSIAGRGQDERGGSRARGRIQYALGEDGPAATRVDLVLAYSLTGPLAQFSRGALVRDVVRQIARTFAVNVEARLANPAAAVEAAKLNPIALLLSVLVARLKALMGLGR